MISEAERLLNAVFGYKSFREGQKKIISNVLQGIDTLGIMPTGGGKSLCYQVPALLFKGVTLVISPLISLMKDQVDGLKSIGIAATFINSSLSFEEVQQRMRMVQAGNYQLIYIAPERLQSGRFQDVLKQLPISLLAIDEAHCISQWGHDFRPSYRSIPLLLEKLAIKPVVVALTATATPEVVSDISQLLNIKKENTFVSGFERKNLSFSVVKGVNKRDFTVSYVEKNKQSAGIIYAATRKEVDQLYNFLLKKGYTVGKYHAGLSDDEREQTQERFLYDDLSVIVATNAFGMGIDKSNVRYVLHYNLPKNMEAYYQEAGRAGRDGEPSECVLLFSPQDIQVQKFLIEQTQLDPTRKVNEYRKLQQMIDYCHTETCLQNFIVHYFGESVQEACGRCENCLDERELEDITTEAQMIFSCVKRMDERFGKTLVAQVLKGSQNKRIKEWRLDRLSTYGLLKDYSEKAIIQMIDFLIAEGYLALTDGQYPVVVLSDKALPVLKGKEKVFRKRVYEAKKIVSDNDLFEQLRALRKEISAREQLPPYIIFSDSTLKEMSAVFPVDEQSMLRIKGVGQAKLEKYGNAFLVLIKKYVSEHGVTPLQGKDTGSTVLNNGQKEENSEELSHVKSYEWFKQGLNIDEIARKRGLSPVTVQGHIIKCASEGYPIDWKTIIPAEQESMILEKIEELGAERLKPLKEALPDEIDYFTIRAVLCRQSLQK